MIQNPVILGKRLPGLSDPGGAEDLLAGKQLIDASGNVLTGSMAQRSAGDLIVSGPAVTVPAGYYAVQEEASLPEAAQATPEISVSGSGLITASAAQTGGYVEGGTKSATHQLTTQAAATITPGTSAKTAVAAGRYTTGEVKVAGSANLTAANIRSGVNIFGVTGTYAGAAPATYKFSAAPSLSGQTLTVVVNVSASRVYAFHAMVYISAAIGVGIAYPDAAFDNYATIYFYGPQYGGVMTNSLPCGIALNSGSVAITVNSWSYGPNNNVRGSIVYS